MNDNPVPPLTILHDLSKELEPYVLYQMTITIPTGSEVKRVEIYTRNQKDKDSAIKVLEKYKAVVDHYWVYINYTIDDASKEVEKLKIGSYKKALCSYLKSAIDHINMTHNDESIYAFVVGFSADHKDISLHWNSESSFDRTLNRYQEK